MSISSIGASSQLQALQQAMFARADLDSDGRLSLDEFQSIGQNLPQPGSSGPARAMRGDGPGAADFTTATMGTLISMQAARSQEIFSGADADADGVLTADELAADMAAHAPPGADGDAATMAADLVSRADADGDGALSLGEFQAAAPPPPGGGRGFGPAMADAGSTAVDALDTDGDGQVGMSELLASLQSSDERLTGFSTEAADLLARLIEQLTADTASTAAATSA